MKFNSFNSRVAKRILILVITGLVLGVIDYVNQSVCMIAFNQPKQPDNIQKYLKTEDLL